MPIVVHKYGGSSVADLEKIKRVAALTVAAKRQGNQVVIVVSAMGKTTDGLLKQAFDVSANPDRRELDMLLSVGERISMSLLTMAIKDLGEDAISFTGSQSGIITTEVHSDARILEVRPTRIQEALAANKVVIVAGYQGVSRNKEVTTLGRGGSDTTAVALAAALDAERCEIFSDVDGVFTADPRVVPDARRLDELSHVEMQEMAESGAKVLNAQAVEWARKAGITIHARRTGDPSPGTRVESKPRGAAHGVRAVTHRTKALWLQAHVPAGELLPLLDEHHAPADLLWLDQGGVQALLPTENLHAVDVLETTLAGRFGNAVVLRQDRGCVSLVGDGLGANHGILRQALGVLSSAGLVAHHVSSSSLRVCLVVDAASVPLAVGALHKAFVERAPGAD